MQHYPSAQAKLAETLVKNLGLDGAIHACHANSWDGVLAILLGRGRRDGAAAKPRGDSYHV